MSENQKNLSLGISPCPNDTFIFYALLHGKLKDGGFAFDHPVLEDVETLNLWALEARLDITKLSFHAFGHVRDTYTLLTSGSALGRGCGPLLVAKESDGDLSEKKIAVPGKYTTAAMLLNLYAPECRNIEIMRFDEIMPAVSSGKVDAGVIIHESRFTYQQYGLKLICDLGSWWEDHTGFPVPLGGIAAKRSLGKDLLCRIDAAIRESVTWAVAHPDLAMSYIKKHAQEMEDDVIRSHIGLYVNSFSEDLGQEGFAAVIEFLQRGEEAGVFPRSSLPVALSCENVLTKS